MPIAGHCPASFLWRLTVTMAWCHSCPLLGYPLQEQEMGFVGWVSSPSWNSTSCKFFSDGTHWPCQETGQSLEGTIPRCIRDAQYQSLLTTIPTHPQRTPFCHIFRHNLLNVVQRRSIQARGVSHLFLNKHIPKELVYSQIAMSTVDP